MEVTRKILFVAALLLCMSCEQKLEFGLPEQAESFASAATYNNKVDMIFIVDDSETMKFAQNDLATSMPGMISSLMAARLDLHVVVISTSIGTGRRGGKFLGSPKVLTNDNSDLPNALAERLKMTGGSDVEGGIESLFRVLDPEYLRTDGQGFLRDDAFLAIIELTNEDDKSGRGTADQIIAHMDNIKKPYENGQRSWVFNLIGTLDSSNRCPTNPDRGYTEKATKLIELVTKTEGVMASICASNLAPAVSNIRARLIQVLSEFPLRSRPNVATIRVYINGAEVPQDATNGWQYIPETNTIRFYGSWLPSADSQIRVDFAPEGAN